MSALTLAEPFTTRDNATRVTPRRLGRFGDADIGQPPPQDFARVRRVMHLGHGRTPQW